MPFLLSAVAGVAGVFVVKVGEIVIDRSAGFIVANQALPAQLFSVL